MTLTAARRRFREVERRLMDSTVTVVRDDGDATYDPDTAVLTQPETTVYTGDALIRRNAWEGSDTEVADTEVRLRTWRLKLPHDAAALRRNDRVTVDASPNGALVGRVLRVTDFFSDDWSPSAAYFCEEVT